MDVDKSGPNTCSHPPWRHVAASIRKYHPVAGITWFSDSCALVHRKGGGSPPGGGRRGDRKGVTELSARSRMRMAFVLLATRVRFASIATLTYHNVFPIDGQQTHADLNRFLTQFRRRLYGNYFWFLEFQKRGAPHFHLLLEMGYSRGKHNLITELWLTATGNQNDDEMRRVHNHEDAYEAVREKDGALRYGLKYATKPTQKKVPKNYQNVGRFWGASRPVAASIEPVGEMVLTEETAQTLLEAFDHPARNWGVVPKVLLNIPNLGAAVEV